MQTVAILYCDPRGPYPSLSVPGIWLECWGLPHRDAKAYDGPWPVVAHPPCGAYGAFKHLHKANDSDCAPRAVRQVRSAGGVLEHPAKSRLWDYELDHFGSKLPRPGQPPDEFGGRTLEVEQVRWGHVATKRTWLYVVRVDDRQLENPPPRKPTHDLMGSRGKNRNVVRLVDREASKELRRRTPPDFARYLVKLAASVTRPRSTEGVGL